MISRAKSIRISLFDMIYYATKSLIIRLIHYRGYIRCVHVAFKVVGYHRLPSALISKQASFEFSIKRRDELNL